MSSAEQPLSRKVLDSPFLNELYLLYEIGKAVNSTLEIEEVLTLIMKLTTDLFKAEAGSIMLLDREGLLTIRAAQGLPQEIVASTRIQVGEGIAGWVAQTGEPLLLDGKVSDPKFKSLVDRKELIKSSLCVPLKRKGKVAGVLILRNPTASPTFTPEHLSFLLAIADQVAIAIENASLYNEQKERAEELAMLNRQVEAIISNMADGLVVTLPTGIMTLLNPPVERIFGINREFLVGKHYSVLFRGSEFEKVHTHVCAQGRTAITELILKKPTEMVFRLWATPMKEPGGEVSGVVTLLQDITELKRITRMKSEFVSLVTHELKTPLTSIQGFVEVLLARDLPRDRIVNYLTIVRQETERLVRLIGDLLDLAKLEEGQFQLNKEPVDLTLLIQGAMEAIQPQLTIHKLVRTGPEEGVKVLADRDLITQVILNLLSNAVKYSPEGGEVVVGLRESDTAVEVDVSDQGVGIPQEKLPHLFERFYRVDSSATRSITGTGLGLANVKYIVEAHGGSLRVKSEVGKGSTFTFSLPVGGGEFGV